MVPLNLVGLHVTLKILKKVGGDESEDTKYMNPGKVKNLTKSLTLLDPTNDPQVIADTCQKLFQQMHLLPGEVRGGGIQVDQLTETKHSGRHGEGLEAKTNQLTKYFKVTPKVEAKEVKEEKEELKEKNEDSIRETKPEVSVQEDSFGFNSECDLYDILNSTIDSQSEQKTVQDDRTQTNNTNLANNTNTIDTTTVVGQINHTSDTHLDVNSHPKFHTVSIMNYTKVATNDKDMFTKTTSETTKPRNLFSNVTATRTINSLLDDPPMPANNRPQKVVIDLDSPETKGPTPQQSRKRPSPKTAKGQSKKRKTEPQKGQLTLFQMMKREEK